MTTSPYAPGLHPGTVWHKCDLQCHTPRDHGWTGSPHLAGGSDAEELERHAWAESLIAAAEAAKLGAIAVTDHHDICMSAHVLEAAARLGSDVLVFPGVEVTCSDNSQCLALFDPATPPETQRLVLAAAGNILVAPDKEATTCKIAPSRETIALLVDKVQAEEHLKDACIIIPHFSKEAHKSLNENGHHPRFANLPVDGVYIERPFHELDEPTVSKVYGKIQEWGTRRRAIVATGDNRSASWSRLGVHNCWIKLGEHTIEAVRQALLADEARISYEPPDAPPERIVELRVKGTLTGADPIRVIFNDGFNALIGGRGSGKSALLEYLRFALGRTDRDFGVFDEKKAERETLLIDETLANGYVEVVLEREGVRETWKRGSGSTDAITVTLSDGNSLSLTPRNARERFRARAFAQKGLSSTMKDPATAAVQITGIAAAEELDQQREIDQGILNAKREVTIQLQNLAAYWQSRVERRHAQARVDDLRQRLTSLSERLSAEGVSAEHLQTIESSPVYARTKLYLERAKKTLDDEATRIFDIAATALKLDPASFAGAMDFEEIAAFQAEMEQLQSAVFTLMTGAVQQINDKKERLKEVEKTFAKRREAFDAKHKEAVDAQSMHRNLIDDVARLTQELQLAESSLSAALATETGRHPAVKNYDTAIENLDKLLQDRRSVLGTAAGKVAGKSSNLLKARVRRDKSPEEYQASLCSLFEASFTQQVEEGCADWVTALLNTDPENGWSELRKTMLSLYVAKIEAGSPPEAPPEIIAGLRAVLFNKARNVTDNACKKIYGNLNDRNIGAIVSSTPSDSIVLSYMDDGRAIDFKIASPGQQASALLELLLRQSAGTLIIDQPEDDLDNRVIMRIVNLIKNSKNKRQLIFTTHNPNVVVNGDADKVIALRSVEPTSNPNVSSARVQIDKDGAIETPDVRHAITSIIEGGRDAFDLRSRKYRFVPLPNPPKTAEEGAHATA